MKPAILVQFPNREKVALFRSGLDQARCVVALGLDPASFSKLAGVDALYMSLTRAERWGARPLPPYSAAVLPTTEADRDAGLPRYVVTGLVLGENDPNTAEFVVPRMIKAVLEAVDLVNEAEPRAIRTVGFFEFELTLPGSSLSEVARLLCEAMR